MVERVCSPHARAPLAACALLRNVKPPEFRAMPPIQPPLARFPIALVTSSLLANVAALL
jgi:hypothetical protein